MPSQRELTETPRTRLTFRLGVVGHRNNQLPDDANELKKTAREVLAEVRRAVLHVTRQHKGLFNSPEPLLRAVSSLADGSDQLAAEAALELGYDLCCPLPFARDELGADDRLLLDAFLERGRAQHAGRTIVEFELDGSLDHETDGYVAAAQVVLNQSDLLLAIWNGEKAAGRGGTAETVEKALEAGLRVIWIHSQRPTLVRVLTGRLRHGPEGAPADEALVPSAMTDLASLPAIVAEALGLPEVTPAEHALAGETNAGLANYYAERRPRLRFAVIWKAFRDLVGLGRLRIPSLKVPRFDAILEADWSPRAPEPLGWVNQQLGQHFCWADALAELKADAYRSSFVVSYALSAAAVLLALLPALFGWDDATAPVALNHFLELAAVMTIIWLLYWGRTNEWHRRWLDYRIVAELVRQLKLQIPLGGARPLPRVPLHLGASGAYGNPAQTWMFWHVRSIEREVGLPHARVPRDYARRCVQELQRVLEAQIEFHQTNHRRAGKIEERLHLAGALLFGVTALLVAVEFASFVFHAFHLGASAEATAAAAHGATTTSRIQLSTLLAAFLPALGAALAAVANQGEFGRIARRSEGMQERLQGLLSDVATCLDAEVVTSKAATDLVVVASQLMVDEVLEWHVLLVDRPLVLS